MHARVQQRPGSDKHRRTWSTYRFPRTSRVAPAPRRLSAVPPRGCYKRWRTSLTLFSTLSTLQCLRQVCVILLLLRCWHRNTQTRHLYGGGVCTHTSAHSHPTERLLAGFSEGTILLQYEHNAPISSLTRSHLYRRGFHTRMRQRERDKHRHSPVATGSLQIYCCYFGSKLNARFVCSLTCMNDAFAGGCDSEKATNVSTAVAAVSTPATPNILQ